MVYLSYIFNQLSTLSLSDININKQMLYSEPRHMHMKTYNWKIYVCCIRSASAETQ